MFRDLYKKANDEIKGDRAILDKAFLQAAQPVRKKSPVIKYSFIGTAVAAVMVLGAVFANPSVFTNRSDEIGKLGDTEPTKSVMAATESADEALTSENSEIVVASVMDDELVETNEKAFTNNTTAEETGTKKTDTQVTANAQTLLIPGGGEESSGSDEEEIAGQDDYAVAAMSLEDEDDGAVAETGTEEPVVTMFKMIGRGATEEPTEEATEEVTEDSEVEAEVFSYMYDMSRYEEGMAGVHTEGFVNTDVSPVTNRDEAVERAKNECTVEYDTVKVYRDNIENIWKVNFSTEWMEGGDCSVYMNSDGITELVVYGE